MVLRQLQDQLLTKTLDDEIRYFKEWSWQLTQYLAAIDNKYSKDLDGLSSNATRAMDMSIASAATRDRNHNFFCSFGWTFSRTSLADLEVNPQLMVLKAGANCC